MSVSVCLCVGLCVNIYASNRLNSSTLADSQNNRRKTLNLNTRSPEVIPKHGKSFWSKPWRHIDLRSGKSCHDGCDKLYSTHGLITHGLDRWHGEERRTAWATCHEVDITFGEQTDGLTRLSKRCHKTILWWQLF